MVLFPKTYSKIFFFSFDLRKATHLFVSTNFREMNELSNSEFFSSSKITCGQLLIMKFSKEIKSIIIIMNICRLLVLPIRSRPLIFFSFLKSIELVSYYKYKNRDFLQFVTIYNFIFHKCGR